VGAACGGDGLWGNADCEAAHCDGSAAGDGVSRSAVHVAGFADPEPGGPAEGEGSVGESGQCVWVLGAAGFVASARGVVVEGVCGPDLRGDARGGGARGSGGQGAGGGELRALWASGPAGAGVGELDRVEGGGGLPDLAGGRADTDGRDRDAPNDGRGSSAGAHLGVWVAGDATGGGCGERDLPMRRVRGLRGRAPTRVAQADSFAGPACDVLS